MPRRWAASADSTRFTCSWPHAKPALFSRLLLLLQHFLHEHGDRISRACYSRLRVLCLFQVTPILELIAVRVDCWYQNCNNHASQGDRRDSYVPLAQLDITSLPRAFVSRLFKFSFALDASCSRDTQAENSLSRGAEFAAAGSASQTDLLTSFL